MNARLGLGGTPEQRGAHEPHAIHDGLGEHGGREAVKRYLSRPQAQEGFDRVRELNLVPYSIEALVLEQPWSALFTPTELETARRRLASVGYPG